MSSSHGKRRIYEDLDAPEPMEGIVQAGGSSHAGSNPSSSSGSKNKKKKTSANERDEGYPPKEYAQFIREVTISYYRVRSAEMLKKSFLDYGEAGIFKLQADLEREFWKKLSQSERFMDCMTKYFHAPKWMAQQVTTATTNIVHVFECVVKPVRGEEMSENDKQFLGKLKWIKTKCEKHSKGIKKVMPWNEQALKTAMEQHMHSGVVWVPEKAKVVPLSGFDAQGGYGKVRKVRIAEMPGIPIYIEFAGKMSTATTEREKREQRSIEALVCPVQHPGVIKFWAIRSNSMEAYTLWGNGDCVRNTHKFKTLASEAMSYGEIMKLKHLTMELCQRIVAYRKNHGDVGMGPHIRYEHSP